MTYRSNRGSRSLTISDPQADKALVRTSPAPVLYQHRVQDFLTRCAEERQRTRTEPRSWQEQPVSKIAAGVHFRGDIVVDGSIAGISDGNAEHHRWLCFGLGVLSGTVCGWAGLVLLAAALSGAPPSTTAAAVDLAGIFRIGAALPPSAGRSADEAWGATGQVLADSKKTQSTVAPKTVAKSTPAKADHSPALVTDDSKDGGAEPGSVKAPKTEDHLVAVIKPIATEMSGKLDAGFGSEATKQVAQRSAQPDEMNYVKLDEAPSRRSPNAVVTTVFEAAPKVAPSKFDRSRLSFLGAAQPPSALLVPISGSETGPDMPPIPARRPDQEISSTAKPQGKSVKKSKVVRVVRTRLKPTAVSTARGYETLRRARNRRRVLRQVNSQRPRNRRAAVRKARAGASVNASPALSIIAQRPEWALKALNTGAFSN